MRKLRNGNSRKRFVRLLICLIALSALLCGCGASEKNDPMAGINSYEDLNDPDYMIGVVNGTTNGDITKEVLPKAGLSYFNNNADLLAALEAGKVDAVVGDSTTWIYYSNKTGGKYRVLDGYLKPFEFGFMFSKTDEGRALCKQMNEFIEKIKADGTLAEIDHNWADEDGEAKMAVDYNSLPAPNGVLTLATTAIGPPFTMMENGVVVGYDIDIISRFCEAYGYGLEISTMTFDGLIPAVNSGKCDIGGNQLTITEERKKSVEFSVPYYSGGTTAAVYNANYGNDKSFTEKLKDSFERTFVAESRYKLFIQGILNTLLITILSAIFGTLIGFAVYMMCRGGNKVANVITRICVRIIQMLPVVVVLLILFYIVFAKASVSGVFVSIVAFSLTFAAAVFGMLTSSVSAIDKGQTEAAYALGFGNLRTFFKVVLPQAMVYFLPSYKSELVSLIKATAVVGYIAVQDLTRMGDIVRSSTYEAFFPLIAVALIYFLLAWILILLAGRFEVRFDPKRRKKEDILKGVKIND